MIKKKMLLNLLLRLNLDQQKIILFYIIINLKFKDTNVEF